MIEAITSVAPRELVDLVHRVVRVGGVDPGTATILGHAVARGCAEGHDAIGALCALVDAGALSNLLAALDALAQAEVDTRAGTPTTVEFSPGVAESLLVHSLSKAADRGTHRMASAQTDGVVTALTLGTGAEVGTADRVADDSVSLALRNGVRVSTARFDDLSSRAAAFLVAESALDAISNRDAT